MFFTDVNIKEIMLYSAVTQAKENVGLLQVMQWKQKQTHLWKKRKEITENVTLKSQLWGFILMVNSSPLEGSILQPHTFPKYQLFKDLATGHRSFHQGCMKGRIPHSDTTCAAKGDVLLEFQFEMKNKFSYRHIITYGIQVDQVGTYC